MKCKPNYSKLNEWEEEFLESLETKADRLERDGKELFMSEKRTEALLKILRKCGLVEGGEEEPPQREYGCRSSTPRTPRGCVDF